MYIAKHEFLAHSAKGQITVCKGQVFILAAKEDLPHPIGKHPDLDGNHFSETDRWVTRGEWKNDYEEHNVTLG